jgi:hypothetical protein
MAMACSWASSQLVAEGVGKYHLNQASICDMKMKEVVMAYL